MKKLLLLAIAALPFFNLAQTIPSYVPTNGLVGWWPFNGNANDESGNGNNGLVNNTTQGNVIFGADRFGSIANSAVFNNPPQWNADGAYISLPSNMNFSFSTNFSFCFWAKPTVSSTPCEVINKGRDNSGAFFSRFSNGYYQLGFNQNVMNYFDTTIYTQWNFFSVIKANSTIFRYKNGSLIDSSIFQNPVNLAPEFWFGKHNEQGTGNGSTYSYIGSLDDIGIWNRALTLQEISDLYNGSVTTGLNNDFQNNELNIFPNPSDGKVNIVSNEEQINSVTLFDASGRSIQTFNVNSKQVQISLEGIESGIYFLSINGEANSLKKIVIQ